MLSKNFGYYMLFRKKKSIKNPARFAQGLGFSRNPFISFLLLKERVINAETLIAVDTYGVLGVGLGWRLLLAVRADQINHAILGNLLEHCQGELDILHLLSPFLLLGSLGW